MRRALWLSIPVLLIGSGAVIRFADTRSAAATVLQSAQPQLLGSQTDAPVRVSVRRDPFIPPLDDRGLPQTPAATQAAQAASPEAPRLKVRAVVLGERSYALIDDGGTARVLAPGDRAGNAIITAVDANGVRFDDGTVLPMAVQK